MSVFQLAAKLRGRSPREIGVRGWQMMSATFERTGWSSQCRIPDDDEFIRRAVHSDARGSSSAEAILDTFRTRETPRFFPGVESRTATIDVLRNRWPAAEAETVERADRVCRGCFDLLGRREVSFGAPIDWQYEPVTGKRTPLIHWSRINHLDPEVVGEYKLTWELNRHPHFALLGQAYWYTGHERYAETWVGHLTAWMDANPPTRGINWSSSLEVAIRAISWIWALHLFRESRQLTPTVYLRALKFLCLHGNHVERYLSTYFSPNTHLTGEALGLFYLGVLLPELRASRRWRDRGLAILLEQLDRQVLEDGVYFERATYYHRYTTDFLAHLWILAHENGIPLEQKVQDRIQALLDHLMIMARPNGSTPFVGDDDGGRLVWLDRREPDDFRAALSTGAALFGREGYRFAAQELAEETVWLLGAEGARRFDSLAATPPAETSHAFRDAGYYVMRDGWDRDSNYLLIDCGPHGVLNGGHAHADALSIDVAARGETMVVDPGTFTYICPQEQRNHFRSSTAHNTLAIDGESSSVPAGPFQWWTTAECRVRAWETHLRFDFFEGSHDGYRRLPAPAEHCRAVLFLKNDYWIVRDRVVSEGPHLAELSLQFAPGCTILEEGRGITATSPARTAMDVVVFGNGVELRREEGCVSRSFGERARAPRCIAATATEGPLDIVSFLMPRKGAEAPQRAHEMAAERGRVFVIDRAEAKDLIALAERGLVRTEELETDFEWTWLRRSDDGKPIEYLLLGGSTAKLDGRYLFACEDRAGYVVARMEESTLVVDTDAAAPLEVAPAGASEVVVNGARMPVDAGMLPAGGSEATDHRRVGRESATR